MKPQKLTYIGTVSADGKITLPKEKFQREVSSSYSGREIEVTVQEPKRYRSDNQNAYYWAVVVPILARALRDVSGYDLEPETETGRNEVHEWLKKEFAWNDRKVKNAKGEELSIPGSTSAMDVEGFKNYLDRIKQFAAEYLGTVIPDPPDKPGYWPEER